MMTREQVEQRLERNSNDIDAIYDMLAEHGQALERIEKRLDAHDTRFDGIDGRLDGIDGRLDGIDGRLDGIDGRLDAHDARFDRIDETLAEVLRRLPAPPA